jgi:hypothetical protein
MELLVGVLYISSFLGITAATVYSLAKFRGSVTGGLAGVLIAIAEIVTDVLRHPPDNTGLIGILAFAELWFLACGGTLAGTAVGALYRRIRKADAIKND